MAAKPGSVPQWATSGAAVTPSAGKQAIGWVAGERPPAQYLNWWQNLVYLWVLYLQGGAFSGASSFDNTLSVAGLLTLSAGASVKPGATEATTTPDMVSLDYAGNVRTTIDHYGFRGGWVSEWDEHWRGTTLPAGWTATILNSATGVLTDPTSSFESRYLLVTLPGAAGVPSYTLTPEYQLYLDNNRVLVLEQTIRTNTLAGNGSNYDWGVQFSHGGANDYFILFRLTNGAGNWLCVTVGSSTASISSGVAGASNTTLRLRLEISGSAISGQAAGSLTIRWYINGTLVRTTLGNTTIPVDKCRYYFKSITNTSGTGDNGVILGPLRMRWNHVLAGDNL